VCLAGQAGNPHHQSCGEDGSAATSASGALLDALIQAAQQRGQPRDLALFLILRYSGMRRESVATLRVRHLDATWDLRGVLVKGGRTRDIPLPTTVMQFLWSYIEQVVSPQDAALDADTPIFWSSWGRRGIGKVRQPDDGEKRLAALQCLRTDDRGPDAEAA
jgi:integrase